MPNVTVYVMTVWQNLPSKSTALEATNLNHIEQGIKNVTDFINTLNTTAGVYLSGAPFTQELLNKLNGIEAQANKYVLPTASDTILGGVKVDGTTITIDNNGIIHGSAAAVTLESLTDVNLYDLQDGQILKYDATTSKWINTSEAEVRTQLSLLEDVDIDDASLTDGQVLKYNATSEKWENGESGDVLGYNETLEILGSPPDPAYIYEIATPIMTGMATPSGVVTQSGKNSSNADAWVMFRRNNNYAQANQTWVGTSTPQWIGYEFPSTKRISKVDIVNRAIGNSAYACKTIIFQASNDGENWIDLSTLSISSSSLGASETFEIDNNYAYKYYRFYISEGYDSSYVSIGCINMYSKTAVY